MRNVETRQMTTEPEAIEYMLTAARMDERRNRAEVMAARLDILAEKIAIHSLSREQAAEMVRDEAMNIMHQAQELH
ncbi:DUF2732 domain-containing protein [Erwiniaceae bacterium BAC15a-03b]|uniref:DUF2732 domain-containing protein n=1 Tax=Winslowiella arboricola TaxID=2978220 RepID=A0A9J6PKB0_9GAMM|nr:DUF2732 family protein [Winslowiella arboricola]MCU5773095.1 DUF2732 domain-containing protein [Winslowiella arboricola]MCU5777810.1 DUF2732 domain-containing protein [Winslowiella arboricola]